MGDRSKKQDATKAGKKKPRKKVKEKEKKCAQKPKLVKITVIDNATQNNVTGNKNWACIKKATDDVIIEATTNPNTEEAWKQITWSGDSGVAVPDKPNQRKLSRSNSKKCHVKAELGGVEDDLYVWVLWAEVTILTSGTTPANAVQFNGKHDGTENLGAVTWDGGDKAAGRVIPVAKITPAGVHDVVKSGWAFERRRQSHDWRDGSKDGEGDTDNDYWNTVFVDDTSYPCFQKLTPDDQDKIYDRDAPSIGRANIATNQETYNNFKQWIEWNSAPCSDKAEWYWKARRKKASVPQVTLKEVDTGKILLPDSPHF
jgi:hypothetical protein